VANTTTVNFSWQMPDPGGSANTWGNTLNATTQAIDAQVFANQQAITAGQAPIGSVTMFAGATPPTGWLICDGSSLATTGTYAALFAVLQYAFGGSGANFNLPNLQGVFPLGAGPSNALGSKAGSYTYTISLANLPTHAHPIVDVAHNHGVNQSPHGHGDPGHAHGVNDGGHTHGGVIRAGGPVQFVEGAGYGAASGTTTDAAATGVSIQAAGTGLQAANANVSLNASGTGLSTTQAVGSGAAMSIVPSYVALNFIIRFE
jgi:hypothetical protein